MKFTPTINLGNAAMSEPEDVAAELARIAASISSIDNAWEIGEKHRILDINGNSVGHWELERR